MVFLFGIASYVSHTYETALQTLVGQDTVWGMVAYVGVTIGAVVVAPFSTVPLIPIATALWGWKYAAFLSMVGWVIGAQIAFFLARRFGAPLVERLVSVEKIRTLEEKLPKKDFFWTVVMLRTTLPVDLLSYGLGLFSSMSSWAYFWATLIGITPFAFAFAYAGTLPIGMQIMMALTVGVVVAVVYVVRRLYGK